MSKAQWYDASAPEIDGAALGALIASYRNARRLSQETAAERCDFDHSLWSRLERGQRSATRETMTRIAVGLRLNREDSDALFLAAGMLPNDLLASHRWDRQMVSMWRALRAANPPSLVTVDALKVYAPYPELDGPRYDFHDDDRADQQEERHTEDRHDEAQQ